MLEYTQATPEYLGSRIGIYGFLYASLYLVKYTIPDWHHLVSLPMEQMQASPVSVLEAYLFLIGITCIHSLAYFGLIKTIGATATGVLQALRAIFVFILSSLLFCSLDAHQCFTLTKGLASILVVFGVFLYSFHLF